jgi:hypothetical protein
MNSIDVLGAILLVPAIYAWSRFNRSSKLFIQVLTFLAFGFIIGLGTKWVARQISKNAIMKTVENVSVPSTGNYDLHLIADIVNADKRKLDLSFTGTIHAFSERLVSVDYEGKKRRVFFNRLAVFDTS